MDFSMIDVRDSAKKLVVDMEGAVVRSEVHLTNLETDEVITLAMCPEEVKAKSTASFRTYNIIERGEVKLPKGEELTDFTWQGILPSGAILMYNFINLEAWERPQELIRAFTRWREQGNKIRLLVTQTAINHDVYLKDFDVEYSGGFGHVKYSVHFVAAKELKILTVEEADKQRQAAKDTTAYEIQRRAAMKERTRILVGNLIDINNMWTIAMILTGNGGNWETLSNKNGIDQPDYLDPGTWVINM